MGATLKNFGPYQPFVSPTIESHCLLPTHGASPVRAKHPPNTPQTHPRPHRRMLRPYPDPVTLPAARPYQRSVSLHYFQSCPHTSLLQASIPCFNDRLCPSTYLQLSINIGNVIADGLLAQG